MNPDDHQVATLMNRATSTAQPQSTASLVNASLVRGRRLRRRRVAVQVGSGVAFCALAATVAVALVPNSPDQPATQRIAVGAQPEPTARSIATTPSTTPSATPPTSTAATAPTQASVLRTFEALLPDHATVTKRSGYTSPGSVGVEVTYDDGGGLVLIDVSVEYPPSGGGLGAACQISICTPRADGTLAVYQGSYRPGHPELQPQQWTVSLRRHDATTVNVTEWNSRNEKSAKSVTRANPPLTIAQLTAIVSSSRWTS